MFFHSQMNGLHKKLLLPCAGQRHNYNSDAEIIYRNRFNEQRLEQSVKKILRAKYRLGLKNFEPIQEDNIREDLNSNEALTLKRQLIENAMTMVRNADQMIP